MFRFRPRRNLKHKITERENGSSLDKFELLCQKIQLVLCLLNVVV